MPSKIKKDMKHLLVAGIILAAFTTYAILFAPPRDKSQFPALICVTLLSYGATLFFAWMVRACNVHLEVTDSHIKQHTPNKPPLVLAWSEITEVKNNAAMQRLELRSKHRNLAITVEHQVENYEVLRGTIATKTEKPLA